MTQTMKAVHVAEQGSPAQAMRLTVQPVPQVTPGHVRLKVEAAGINFADVLAVSGEYLTRTKYPYTPGMEFAGVIEELGQGVQGFQVGQRVACLAGTGGLAQYAVVPAQTLVPVPQSFSAAQAASFPVSYLTAYHGLKTLGQGKGGEWVLVQAAAGGPRTHGRYFRAGALRDYDPVARIDERAAPVWEMLCKRLERLQPGILQNLE